MSDSSQSNDLRNRILFLLILSIYRFGTFVAFTEIDPEQLKL